MYLLIPGLSGRAEASILFTSHYVSINSNTGHLYILSPLYLHPTMYLLIRFACNFFAVNICDLHPTMYLLILIREILMYLTIINLHPTMYLLIRIGNPTETKFASIFTSHYVSINSRYLQYQYNLLQYLHPTMYLLILKNLLLIISLILTFTSHYVSINSVCVNNTIKVVYQFTSHYVSINSHVVFFQVSQHLHLHPTMYLLIPVYFVPQKLLSKKFTSHYVSINS